MRKILSNLYKYNNPLYSKISVSDAKVIDGFTVNIHQVSAKLIEDTQEYAFLAFYKFYPESDGGKSMISALENLSERSKNTGKKIVVRFLLNARGFPATIFYRENNQTGLEELAKKINHLNFELSVGYHCTKAFGSYHSKYIIIDGEKCLLRSADSEPDNNVASNRLDTATLIEGQLVMEIQEDFLFNWGKINNRNYKKSNRSVFSLKNKQEYKLYLEKQIEFLKEENDRVSKLPSNFSAGVYGNQVDLQKKKELLTKELKSLPGDIENSDYFDEKKSLGSKVIFLSKNSDGNPIKKHGYSPFKAAIIAAIYQAKGEIEIVTPNINDGEIIEALADACDRGVSVQIIMGKFHNEKSEKYWGGTNEASMARLISLVKPSNLDFVNIHWATMPTVEYARDQIILVLQDKISKLTDELKRELSENVINLKETNDISEIYQLIKGLSEKPLFSSNSDPQAFQIFQECLTILEQVSSDKDQSQEELVPHSRPYTVHGKYYCFDRKIFVIGSSPMDTQAIVHSREVDIVVNDTKSAKKLSEKFFIPRYTSGRDYFVDKFIERIQNYQKSIITSDEKSAETLRSLTSKLKKSGTTIHKAYNILSEDDLTDFRSRHLIFDRIVKSCLNTCEKILRLSPGDNYDQDLLSKLDQHTNDLGKQFDSISDHSNSVYFNF
jgi:phosphatidylserine/phosphatidylglycerophosphate/cardiolipin synthase-like enzyme